MGRKRLWSAVPASVIYKKKFPRIPDARDLSQDDDETSTTIESGDKLTPAGGDAAAASHAALYQMEYSKKFVIVADSLFRTFKERNREVVGVMVYPNDSNVHSVDVVSKAEIRDYASNVLKYNSRDATHVLSFGYDALTFRAAEDVNQIAVNIRTALNEAAKKIRFHGIDLWFLTVPEIGDFADKFKQFNDFFRSAGDSGQLNVSLFDFAQLLHTRPKTTEPERFRMLLSFFEQRKQLVLLPPLPPLESFVVKPDPPKAGESAA